VKSRKTPQLSLLASQPKSYGGDLLRTRIGRAHGRPIDTHNSMHLVLRSTKATGDWSFWRGENKVKIQRIVTKFSLKYGVKVFSMANVGNHIHFHIKLSNRYTYKPFIRALTSAIAMAVTGASRWNKLEDVLKERFGSGLKSQTKSENQFSKAVKSGSINESGPYESSPHESGPHESGPHESSPYDVSAPLKASHLKRFWDCRPFTRVVIGFKALLNLKDYIEINQLEGFGFQRSQAKFFLKWNQLKILESD
jgi:REP element-mobilizing transposase RayT